MPAAAVCSGAMRERALAKVLAMLVLAELLYWNAALVIGTLGKVGRVACMGSPVEGKRKARSAVAGGLGVTRRRVSEAGRSGVVGSLLGFCLAEIRRQRKGPAGLDQLQQPLLESFLVVDARGTCSAGLWRSLMQVHCPRAIRHVSRLARDSLQADLARVPDCHCQVVR